MNPQPPAPKADNLPIDIFLETPGKAHSPLPSGIRTGELISIPRGGNAPIPHGPRPWGNVPHPPLADGLKADPGQIQQVGYKKSISTYGTPPLYIILRLKADLDKLYGNEVLCANEVLFSKADSHGPPIFDRAAVRQIPSDQGSGGIPPRGITRRQRRRRISVRDPFDENGG